MSQFVILLRCVKQDSSVERFVSFLKVQNYKTEVAAYIKKNLPPYKFGQIYLLRPVQLEHLISTPVIAADIRKLHFRPV
jgi:hypothetical protein